MSHLLLKLPLIALLLVAFGYGRPLIAQNQFTGNQQSANPLIKLKSDSHDPAADASQPTSRDLVVNPNQIQYEDVNTPLSVRKPRSPLAQSRQQLAPSVFQSINAPKPSAANYYGKPPAPTVAASKVNVLEESRIVESDEQVTVRNNLVATEIRSPRFVNVNQQAQLRVDLRNMGDENVDNVKLVATLPTHAKFASSSPRPSKVEGQVLTFVIARLAGEKTQPILINVVPTEKIALNLGTQIILENIQQTVVAVRQPKFTLKINGPRQATTGKNLSHVVTITNVGDGTANNIRLNSTYPSGLEHVKSAFDGTIPSLEPGQSLDIPMNSRALKPGQGQFKVVAKSQFTKPEESMMDLVVFQPELRLSATGPKINFVERDGIYSIDVENTGEVDVTNVHLSLAVPQGMKVTTISRQAQVDAASGILTWKFKRLAAKSNEQIQLKATALKEGQQVCQIRITSDETIDKEFSLATEIRTRADVSVRIKNQTGPVQVGAKAVFVVEIENHGSRQANEVSVVVELPDSLTPVKDGRPQVQSKNQLAFDQPMISAGEKATFTFSAVGVAKGDHVVRSTLETGSSTQKVISEDSVFVYEVDVTRVSEALSPTIPR